VDGVAGRLFAVLTKLTTRLYAGGEVGRWRYCRMVPMMIWKEELMEEELMAVQGRVVVGIIG